MNPMRRNALLAAAALPVLAACQAPSSASSPAPAPGPAPAPATAAKPGTTAPSAGNAVMPGSAAVPSAAPAPAACNAQPAQGAVGQPVSDALAEQVRAQSGARRVRVIRPGEAVTKEFDTGRVNIEVDAGGRIARVYCG